MQVSVRASMKPGLSLDLQTEDTFLLAPLHQEEVLVHSKKDDFSASEKQALSQPLTGSKLLEPMVIADQNKLGQEADEEMVTADQNEGNLSEEAAKETHEKEPLSEKEEKTKIVHWKDSCDIGEASQTKQDPQNDETAKLAIKDRKAKVKPQKSADNSVNVTITRSLLGTKTSLSRNKECPTQRKPWWKLQLTKAYPKKLWGIK